MTRQEAYIAELNQLLFYMTPWDKAEALKNVNKQFAEAENEAELLDELGTPMKLAVTLHRSYEPTPEPTPEELAARAAAEAAAEEAAEEVVEPVAEEPTNTWATDVVSEVYPTPVEKEEAVAAEETFEDLVGEISVDEEERNRVLAELGEGESTQG